MPPSEGRPDCGGPLGSASEPGHGVLGCARRDRLAAVGSVEAAGTLPALLLGVFFLDMIISLLLLLSPRPGPSHARCRPSQTRTRPAAAAEAAAVAASPALGACPAPASLAAQPLRPGLPPHQPMATLGRSHANKPAAPRAESGGSSIHPRSIHSLMLCAKTQGPQLSTSSVKKHQDPGSSRMQFLSPAVSVPV